MRIVAEAETASGIAVPQGADHGVPARLAEVRADRAEAAHGRAARVGRQAWEAVVVDGGAGAEAEAEADDAE